MSSRESPLFVSGLSEELLGNQLTSNIALIDRLLEEVKQDFLKKRWVVGSRPLKEGDEQKVGIYVEPPYRRRVKIIPTKKDENNQQPAPVEEDYGFLSPAEAKVLLSRILGLKDLLKEVKIGIDTKNPLFPREAINFGIADLTPKQISESLTSAVGKIRSMLFQHEAAEDQPPLCQWLIRTCLVSNLVFLRTGKGDFWKLVTDFTPEGWNDYLRGIYRQYSTYIFTTEKNSDGNGNGKVVPGSLLTAYLPEVDSTRIAPDVIEIQDPTNISEKRKLETVTKLDPEVDNHLALIIEQLGITDPSKKLTFFVRQITRTLGINPGTLRRWEDDRKIINRAGNKSKRDKHPFFDSVEAIWIGYINGNYVTGGISSKLPPIFRWYIGQYLNKLIEEAGSIPVSN